MGIYNASPIDASSLVGRIHIQRALYHGGCWTYTSVWMPVGLTEPVRVPDFVSIQSSADSLLRSLIPPHIRSRIDGMSFSDITGHTFSLCPAQVVYACLSNTLLLTVLVSVRHSVVNPVLYLIPFCRFFRIPFRQSAQMPLLRYVWYQVLRTDNRYLNYVVHVPTCSVHH